MNHLQNKSTQDVPSTPDTRLRAPIGRDHWTNGA